MKSECTIKIMSRETELGSICNRTGFFFSNCIMNLLDGICGQETNIQHLKYSASHTVSHSQCSSLWVKPPVSVWEELIGIWFWVCFWAKSFEALFVLKHGITMNFLTDHFPNDHISCSEISHLPLWLHQHCNYMHSATPSTSSENAIICAQIETGLKEMCHSDRRHRLGVCITSTAELFWFWVWISFTRRVGGNFYRNLPH